MTFQSISAPRWGDAAGTILLVDVVLAAGEDPVEYVARATDPHGGAELFARALADEFGEIAAWAEPDPVEPLPEPFPALTRRQLRLGLLSIGIASDDVEASIATIADATDRATALIEWQDASSYERDHHLIDMVAATLDLPPAQVDDLWRWASAL